MTTIEYDNPAPEWLTVGAKVALVDGRTGASSLRFAYIVKLTKRDIVLDGSVNDMRFRHKEQRREAGDIFYRHYSGGTWGHTTELRDIDDTRVVKVRNEIAERRARNAVEDTANEFRKTPTPETARAITDAVLHWLVLTVPDDPAS